MSYRARIALVTLGAPLVLFVLDTAYEGYKTLKRLDVIEAERDQWQRPADIIRALDLKPGNVTDTCFSITASPSLSTLVG